AMCVRTEIAEAPPSVYACAMSAGRLSSANTPMLGVRCFISAMSASPGLRSAPMKSLGVYAATASSSWSEPMRWRRRCRSWRASSTSRLNTSSLFRGPREVTAKPLISWGFSTLRDCGPALQHLAGASGVDRLRGQAQAILPVVGQAGGSQCCRGVQQHHVATRALRSAEHLASEPRVLRRTAAAHRFHRRPLQAELRRVELVFLSVSALRAPGAGAVDLDHERR